MASQSFRTLVPAAAAVAVGIRAVSSRKASRTNSERVRCSLFRARSICLTICGGSDTENLADSRGILCIVIT